MRFTDNEKHVLKLLLDNGRITDRHIAKELNISPQAVGKIRKKLEKNGIIESYTANLSFEKLGIKSFAIIYSDWFHTINPEIRRRINLAIKWFPEVIIHVQLSGDEHDFITFLGFRNQEEMERYFIQAKEVFQSAAKFRRVSPFTINNLLKLDLTSIFKHILDNRPTIWNPEIDGPEFEKMIKDKVYKYSDAQPYRRVYQRMDEDARKVRSSETGKIAGKEEKKD